jgi:hypothetical protein
MCSGNAGGSRHRRTEDKIVDAVIETGWKGDSIGPLESARQGSAIDREEVTMATRKIGRDASTGEFIPVKDAINRPRTTTVETIKTPPPKKGK